MAFGVDLAALALAFVLTIIEMTEVVALVFAIGAEGNTHRAAAGGAVTGVAVVAGIAAVVGVGLTALPRTPLLAGAALTLALFGVFLLRSTLRTYRRARAAAKGVPPAAKPGLPFAGGVTVGAVEATEVVIVLVALAAGGNGFSALLGALLAGAVLVVVALAVHERVRRVKVPTLKVGATSALFAFAVFWGGEALGDRGFVWPGTGAAQDLWLLPLWALSLGVVWLAVRWDARRERGLEANG